MDEVRCPAGCHYDIDTSIHRYRPPNSQQRTQRLPEQPEKLVSLPAAMNPALRVWIDDEEEATCWTWARLARCRDKHNE